MIHESFNLPSQITHTQIQTDNISTQKPICSLALGCYSLLFSTEKSERKKNDRKRNKSQRITEIIKPLCKMRTWQTLGEQVWKRCALQREESKNSIDFVYAYARFGTLCLYYCCYWCCWCSFNKHLNNFTVA